jgi:hypothetical protein
MKKASNSDNIEFACLTNENIHKYLLQVPEDVEEITIWNYKMCMYPILLEIKEPLCIPSLKRFSKLIFVRIYNERLAYLPELPEQTKQIMFVSCIVDNLWINICLSLEKYNEWRSNANCNLVETRSAKQAMSLLNEMSPYIKNTNVNKNVSKEIPIYTPIPFWRKCINAISNYCSCMFSTSYSRVSPQIESGNEIEMIQTFKQNETHDPAPVVMHTLGSITRLKKIYDTLINDELVYVGGVRGR